MKTTNFPNNHKKSFYSGNKAGLEEDVIIYGWHACQEALLNPNRVVTQILLNKRTQESIKMKDLWFKISRLHLERPLPIILTDEKMDSLFCGLHQGIAIKVRPLSTFSLENLCQNLPKQAIILVLDQITDPQNIGGILRACRVFDVKGVVMTQKHAPKESCSMVKIACGAFEHVHRVVVPNLAEAIKQLKKNGFWIIGLMEKGPTSFHKLNLTGKVALVMGSEGKGVRSLTGDLCDFKAFLPTSAFSTLNVTTATAIALYEAFLQQNQNISAS